MLERADERQRIVDALARTPVVLLVGARQVGKTTLARSFLSPESPAYFDLENPVDLVRLSEPMTALSGLTDLVVIDEVQRTPDLFPVLRVLADRRPLPARFLILGSASPTALRQSSESLTGRIEVIELDGLQPVDAGVDSLDQLWLRGGFPSSFTATTEDDSVRWRTQYVRNLSSRDLPEFGIGLPSATVQRFLGLIAHVHGQLWNNAEPARALGISESTVRKYIDVLADTLLIRTLQPWHENLAKRQVRMPKVYFRDTGIAHTLLGINNQADLLRHMRSGATWEGFVLESIVHALDGVQPYFWRTSKGAELDLFIEVDGKRVGVEIKRADAPRITPSMRNAIQDLGLNHLFVMYPGDTTYELSKTIRVVPFTLLVEDPSASFLRNA